MTIATFTSRFRSVRLFSQQASVTIQHVGRGLQIREDRFDSGTRLQYLADLACGFSTSFSTFAVRTCSVPQRIRWRAVQMVRDPEGMPCVCNHGTIGKKWKIDTYGGVERFNAVGKHGEW